ncbi:nickel-dependent hydrogenase large subunit [Methanobrevibacter oralis]|uniref:NADH-quinone oxidoreductase subunit 4 n=1 Tax=Methanobrevibacter oralis TaxID=66851 RepID=A0A166BHQ9_METOA|nr:nickel-dependent hydrogenase large subunit [Methanobrevibacter oralis]KZX13366.1 NADH-quinone oxidoreductase subunit 4 [Methanobrevibacter oralis]
MIVPLGPIHPAFKEPIRLKLQTEGERVVKAEIEYGYVHRGIEKIIEGKTWQKGIYLAERVCGICSYEHTQTFAETIEKISDVDVPLRAQFLRVITNELDRIQSHLLANSTYFKSLDHETLFMKSLELREYAMDAIELLTGNRVNMGWNVVGGVKMDADERHFKAILDNLKIIEDGFESYRALFAEGPVLGLRSKGIGVMTKKEAIKGRSVGPIGRASNVKEDYRNGHYTYDDHFDFKVIRRSEGDNYARALTRYDELPESISLVRQAIDNIPEGDIRIPVKLKSGYGEIHNEAPRGEVAYMIETNGNLIKHISIRTPSIANMDSCAKYMIRDVPTIADAVATYVSCDPCVACAERVAITNEHGKTIKKDVFEVI